MMPADGMLLGLLVGGLLLAWALVSAARRRRRRRGASAAASASSDGSSNSSRHGGELVAAALHAHGIRHVFTLVGGHISPILVGCEKVGIRVIDTRHEARRSLRPRHRQQHRSRLTVFCGPQVTAVFAADAVARLSGVPGVAIVTAGPGLTNTVTAVKNAQMAESPVLLIGGAAASLLKGRGALQDIDQVRRCARSRRPES